MAKNTNRFDLGKSSDKKFDLGKGSERKFDLTKDDEELDVQNLNNADSSSLPNETEPKKKWPYIVGALVILALLIWGLSKCGGEQNEDPTANIPVAADTTQTAPTDSVAAEVVPSENAESTTEEPNAEVQSAAGTAEPAKAEDPVQKDTPKAESAPVATTPQTAKPSTNNNVPSNIEQKALQVVRGEYGNGQERKNNLGAEYDAIQQRVNEMYKQGLIN